MEWPLPASAEFIVFEGIDRSGKTTQVNLLGKYLTAFQIPHEIIAFPDRTTQVGQQLDSYLKGKDDATRLPPKAVHMLFSINRWECQRKIKDALRAGKLVIADRYALSGYVYSRANDLEETFCVECDKGIIIPDRMIFLCSDPFIAQHRGDYGKEKYETTQFQCGVAHWYEQAMKNPENHAKTTTRIMVDGKSEADVFLEVIKAICSNGAQ